MTVSHQNNIQNRSERDKTVEYNVYTHMYTNQEALTETTPGNIEVIMRTLGIYN